MSDAFDRPRARLAGVDATRRLQRQARDAAAPSVVVQRGLLARVEKAREDVDVASETAEAAQDLTIRLREAIAQPGVNKFDTAPIVEQDIAGYTTVNLTGYSWIPNGIRLQTPEQTAVGVNLFTLDTFSVRPGDVLSASVTLAFDDPAIAGFGWSFFTADGTPISSSAATNGFEDGLLQSEYEVPAGAAALRMNLYAYVPNGYAVTRTWVEFRNPYVGILVGSDGLAKDAVERVHIGPGAVGPDELGPDVVMGVADDSLTTPKYQDESVTSAKILSLVASKLTGIIALARIPTSLTGLAWVESVMGRFASLTRPDGSSWMKVLTVSFMFAVTPTNATVTAAGTQSAVAGKTNDSGLAIASGSGTWRMRDVGVFGITLTPRTLVYPISARSFVDVEQYNPSTAGWDNVARLVIPNGEDKATTSFDVVVTATGVGTDSVFRALVYRQVATTSQPIQTTLLITRRGDFA
jgi:hypothetical protein